LNGSSDPLNSETERQRDRFIAIASSQHTEPAQHAPAFLWLLSQLRRSAPSRVRRTILRGMRRHPHVTLLAIGSRWSEGPDEGWESLQCMQFHARSSKHAVVFSADERGLKALQRMDIGLKLPFTGSINACDPTQAVESNCSSDFSIAR
jgi:hypothetical protein